MDLPQPQNDEDMHEGVQVVAEKKISMKMMLWVKSKSKRSLFETSQAVSHSHCVLTDSARSNVPPQFTMYAFALIAHKMDIIHHMTASKALNSMRQPAIEAIVKELHNIWLKDVWVPVRVVSDQG